MTERMQPESWVPARKTIASDRPESIGRLWTISYRESSSRRKRRCVRLTDVRTAANLPQSGDRRPRIADKQTFRFRPDVRTQMGGCVENIRRDIASPNARPGSGKPEEQYGVVGVLVHGRPHPRSVQRLKSKATRAVEMRVRSQTPSFQSVAFRLTVGRQRFRRHSLFCFGASIVSLDK